MKKNIWLHGFYAKMLFVCVLLLCISSLIISNIVGSFAEDYERVKFLKSYDIALNNLHSVFYSRLKNFHNTLAPLFDSPNSYKNLCTFLSMEEGETPSNAVLSQTIEIIRDISRKDSSCDSIILYSEGSKYLYQYNNKYKTLNRIILQSGFPGKDNFSLYVLADSELNKMSPSIYKSSNSAYGLVGTIFESERALNMAIGKVVVLYSDSDFEEVIQNNHVESNAIFSIKNRSGEEIYRSKADFLLPDIGNLNLKDYKSTTETINDPVSLTEQEGQSYYTSTIYNGRYEYFVQYYILEQAGQTGYLQTLIMIVALITCLVAGSLYFISFRIAAKKVNIIQKGMNKIGSNNLNYRIPQKGGHDEFSQIIEGFNRMCDELQTNVEQSYVYELQQKKSELYALQTSINPHFLYNTLEMIRVQALQGKKNDASQMLLLLSKIYRSQTNRNMYVSLEEELELCENLIYLYQYRYGNFEYDFSVPEELYPYGLPKNIFQPLIENYFAHGLDSTRDDNFLSLTAEKKREDEKEFIEFILSDNGLSIEEKELDRLNRKLSQSVYENKDNSGFALSNVHNRLRIVFGEGYGIYPGIGEGGEGFLVICRIPLVLPQVLNRSEGTIPAKQ